MNYTNHQDAKGGRAVRAAERGGDTFDTPIPEELQSDYAAWYKQLPKNLQYTGDYDLQGAWLERLGHPSKYEPTQNGHLDDYGKKPNHPTFSNGSKWHDPNDPKRTGGEWKQSDDGSWDFYPGSGNQMSDEELERYFEKYEKGNRVHKRETRSDIEGGDTMGTESVNSVNEIPEESIQSEQTQGGPRIVVNPKVFSDKRDALCVALNEAFRIIMEELEFEPMSEPTEKQRQFFSDTAYSEDELQLRRTILARICTFDTSVTDPTQEQLEEAIEFLELVMKNGIPQNQWEQQAVQRIHDVLVQAAKVERSVTDEAQAPEAPVDTTGTTQGAVGGGVVVTDEDREKAREQIATGEDIYTGIGTMSRSESGSTERTTDGVYKNVTPSWMFQKNKATEDSKDPSFSKLQVYDSNGNKADTVDAVYDFDEATMSSSLRNTIATGGI